MIFKPPATVYADLFFQCRICGSARPVELVSFLLCLPFQPLFPRIVYVSPKYHTRRLVRDEKYICKSNYTSRVFPVLWAFRRLICLLLQPLFMLFTGGVEFSEYLMLGSLSHRQLETLSHVFGT